MIRGAHRISGHCSLQASAYLQADVLFSASPLGQLKSRIMAGHFLKVTAETAINHRLGAWESLYRVFWFLLGTL